MQVSNTQGETYCIDRVMWERPVSGYIRPFHLTEVMFFVVSSRHLERSFAVQGLVPTSLPEPIWRDRRSFGGIARIFVDPDVCLSACLSLEPTL